MLDWLKDYLSNKIQYTSMSADCKSGPMTVTCGVPQGIVLGPIMFLIYVNDFANVCNASKIRLFADDTNIFLVNSDLHLLNNDCNKALEEVSNWMLANRLSINLEKTNYMLFSPFKHDVKVDNIKLVLNGVELVKTNCVKYLGVLIDDRLKWRDQIKSVYNSVMKYVGIFYKLRYKLSQACLKNLYFATVYPSLQYGIELYENTNKTFINDLMVLNNKILRILQIQPLTCNVKELYRRYNTLPINELHTLKIALLMHKYFAHNEILPKIFQNYFTINSTVHSYCTRTQTNIHLERFSTKFGARCLNFYASKIWNSIPTNIKLISLIKKFKAELSLLYLNST